MKEHIAAAWKLLQEIYSSGTYLDRVFDGESPSALTARLVNGVLEQDVKISYILSRLIEKKPQRSVAVLLKIGVYALLNLDNVPDYAVVSECVEVMKDAGKGGASGFVNAVLKRVSRREYSLPSTTDKNYLSVNFSKPQWFLDKMISEYGRERTLSLLEEPEFDKVHLRVNGRISSYGAVKSVLDAHAQENVRSAVGGIITSLTPVVANLFNEGVVTYQSPSSVLAVDALSPHYSAKILDLCAAPGGKSVYASELAREGEVVACDLHPHRVNLIKKYAARMKADNIRAVVADATKFDPQFEDAFDAVIADVPCSCFGTYRRHPDVFLQRGEEAIKTLAATQKKILRNAVRYLKKGGTLIYSTCTLFKEENEDNADYAASLGLTPEVMPISYRNDGRYKILPRGEWDGFFITRFRK